MTSHCRIFPIYLGRYMWHLRFSAKTAVDWMFTRLGFTACMGITDTNGRTEYKQARFSSFTKGLQELADWLAKYDSNDVCMESTGKFWIPVFNILEKTCWVTLAYPKYTKPKRATKPTIRMPSGFVTCICAIWSTQVLSLRRTFASCAT